MILYSCPSRGDARDKLHTTPKLTWLLFKSTFKHEAPLPHAVRIIASLVKHSWLESVSGARWGQAEILMKPAFLCPSCCTCSINSPEEESTSIIALVSHQRLLLLCPHLTLVPGNREAAAQAWSTGQANVGANYTTKERLLFFKERAQGVSEGREFFYFLFIFVANKS